MVITEQLHTPTSKQTNKQTNIFIWTHWIVPKYILDLFIFFIKISALFPEKLKTSKTSPLAMLRKVRKNYWILTKRYWGPFLAEIHPPSTFHGKPSGRFYVILLKKKQPRNKLEWHSVECILPQIPFNYIKPDLMSIKTCLHPLDSDFFWFHIKLYSLIDTSHLNVPDFFIQIHLLIPDKLLRNSFSCHFKESEKKFSDPSPHPDLQQKLMGSFLGWDLSSIQVLGKSVQYFCVFPLTNQPTNKQTNKWTDTDGNITSSAEVIKCVCCLWGPQCLCDSEAGSSIICWAAGYSVLIYRPAYCITVC